MITVIRAGVARGGIEIRHSFQSFSDLWGYFFPAIGLLVTVFFMRNAHVPGTSFSLGARTLPSAFGMNLVFGGLVTVAQLLLSERQDGTLLRAKATPNGMSGYLIGKVVLVGGMTMVSMLLQIVPGVLIIKGLHVGPSGWLTLLWLLPLAMAATMPIGAVFGSLFENPQSLAIVILPLIGLIAISGIFYPISAMPGWFQGVAQVFPVYWVGLGMRSVFLPGSLASAELTHSWRHLETAGVLTLWAILGLALAPVILRRMARRESGSAVAARRDRAIATMRG